MARISELHYSNTVASNTGVPEFIEIALTPAEHANPGDFTVSYYHTDGNLILELDLTDPRVTAPTGPDPETGEFVYVVSSANTGVDITDPNGNATNNASAFSLTNTTTNTVIDFYDIGGGISEITANNGAAAGATSENIDLNGVSPNAIGGSIQFNQPDPDNFVVAPVGPGDTGVCFVRDTRIETDRGAIAVQDLKIGDRVKTKENGYQPIHWIGSRKTEAKGKLAPIVISAGRFKNTEDLLVSPEHRILISDWRTDLLFGLDAVLVPAKSLVDGDKVYRREGGMVHYFHIACASHEILFANGVEAESFLPTPFSLSLLTPEAKAEFLTLFPEFEIDETTLWHSQFSILTSNEAQLLGNYRRDH